MARGAKQPRRETAAPTTQRSPSPHAGSRHERLTAAGRAVAGQPRLTPMATFIMLATLTPEGGQTVKSNPDRISEVNREAEALGVKVLEQWATLGEFDFVSIIDAPDVRAMMRLSMELGSRGTARYLSYPAIPVDEF